MVQDEGAEMMIASHNQVSIERAVALVQRHGMDPSASGIFFGQLLGMADHLTFVLGQNGFRVPSDLFTTTALVPSKSVTVSRVSFYSNVLPRQALSPEHLSP